MQYSDPKYCCWICIWLHSLDTDLEKNKENNPFSYISECPSSIGGNRRFYCPSTNERQEWVCITFEQLCNTQKDCPQGDDEDELMCLYHRPVSIQWHLQITLMSRDFRHFYEAKYLVLEADFVWRKFLFMTVRSCILESRQN